MSDNVVTQTALNSDDLTDVQVTDTETAANKDTTRANLKEFLVDHGLLTLALLLITLGGTLFLSWFGAKQADKWTEGLRYAPTNQQISTQVSSEEAKRLQAYIDKIPNATFEEKARLFKQLKEIENRAKSHISVARAFYIWNYQSISIATASSIVTAVSLFFLSRKGWNDANKYVVNVFIVSFGITVIVGVFPALFKQEENISNNTRTYLAYIALDDRVNTYIATKRFIGIKPVNTNNTAPTEPLTNIKDVIRSVDDELATLNNIYVGFDATKVPNYREVFNEVNQ